MEENNGSSIKIIGALVVGAIAGAALGVLFAPDKGSSTRSKIIDGADDLAREFKRKMRSKANDLRQKAEELEHLAEEKLDDLKTDIKSKATDFVNSK
ncbi:MAG: YtxH domain-containing protein [Bacteroidetes bacterium]|nr:YtxH domain-containing protein [Bacteroidota bacterium]MBP6426246.1 YtxH domain-containing protein [Bacteroidia bacterium]MBK8364893.1 YtxH domain-containing protein [Bacteroidota bacterium]MBK9414265.1 YtxH domain-containing protein [Bacteroidota bacterium]MBL0030820.1 YtxH domain-containing protein [Bacteroidota bacterium]